MSRVLPITANSELPKRLLQYFLPGSVAFGFAMTLAAEAYGADLRVSVFGFFLTMLPFAGWALGERLHREGRWLLVGGYLAIGLLSAHWLGGEALAALLPVSLGLAAVLLGPAPAAAAAVLVSLLVLGGVLAGSVGVPIRIVAVAGIWATQALAWSTVGHATQAIEEAEASYQKMRSLLEEARDQRLELKQTQEDLLLANKELARISERLEAMRRVAEEARRAKEEFVANVSHELRTPLNMIVGFSELITRTPRIYGSQLPTKLLADIDIVRASGQHLAGLIDDVLDLSQIDAGRMALTREWASLREIAEAALLAVTPLFEAKGLTIGKDIPEELPALFCDRTRIRQVLLNLLSNAGRFTERGGARVCVRQEGPSVLVSVSDTGPGLSAEDQKRIFQPFTQADGSIRSRYGGSGLGLAISKRFVEMHGGRMWLESEAGKGATFHFSLPLEAPVPQGQTDYSRWFNPYQEYQPRTRRSRAPQPQLAPRFVVVESGDTLHRLLTRYQNQAEVAALRNLDEAAAELRRVPAQALIVNQPPLQAPTDPAATANVPPGTPVITCWLHDRREAAERLGLVGYLTKPLTGERLLAALDQVGRPLKTILVVDDEPEAQQLLGRMLAATGRGYRILRASTGQRALGLLRDRRPDVMLLDLLMPGMDGYEVLQRKNEDPGLRSIPVVAVSAQDLSREIAARLMVSLPGSGGLEPANLLRLIGAIVGVLAPDRLA